MPISESDILPDPIAQFRAWQYDHQQTKPLDSDAMTLATVDREGQPFARIVLLKDVSDAGFTFYTNYNSVKAANLAENPKVALVFHWSTTGRQVRVRGTAEKVDPSASEAYFHSRPRESRIGAWASPQSAVIPDRAFLEKRFADLNAQYAQGEVPRPPHWGGYLVRPTAIEFWQLGDHRLHDRFLFTRTDGEWKRERLAP
jgi:pyridoxamine 5'-phosphate oxidase